ncbi:uncharacterized protein METZ01_LOCUS197089, partial [marine metagenome]|jgi:hypothetical protein|tara:strand:+ start:9141 stop:9722 length:582 start_codon:yes stop_codon:yes gene_type:complete
VASLFDKLESEAFRKGLQVRSKEAQVWFQKKAKALGPIGRKILNDERLTQKSDTKAGDMCMFIYDPKLKQTLPYYDTFPLAILVGAAKGGFYGINLHYLPPKVRAIFLDKLGDIVSNNKFNATTKFRITYNLLKATKNYKYFKPCFKHYLSQNISSEVMKVNAAEWNIAIFLQTASWRKASESKIWADSKGQY